MDYTKAEIVELFERSKLRENLKHTFKQGIIKTKTCLLEQRVPQRLGDFNEHVLLSLLDHLMVDTMLIDNFVDGLMEGTYKGADKAKHVVDNPPTLATTDGVLVKPKAVLVEKPNLTIVE